VTGRSDAAQRDLWVRRAGYAQAVWNQLTSAELAGAHGDAERLAGLVRERYTLSRREAELQVKRFLQQLDSSDAH
jgi:hypothetical protein